MSTSENSIKSTIVRETNLDPWPIGEENILSGDPQAYGSILWQSEDKLLCNGVWSCTIGKFNSKYIWNETFYIVEGTISILVDNAHLKEYTAGDLVFIRNGTYTTWTVINPIRKVFYLESGTPLEF
tara:strand:- start:62 stop:439 length:378 start_codon:yes stop_codon:yes gene_type:complete